MHFFTLVVLLQFKLNCSKFSEIIAAQLVKNVQFTFVERASSIGFLESLLEVLQVQLHSGIFQTGLSF